MPRVTMKGTTRKRVINSPLSNPNRAQTNTAVTAAARGPNPVLFNNQAITTVPRATTEPTERSIPPEMITSVMPRAAIPTMVV